MIVFLLKNSEYVEIFLWMLVIILKLSAVAVNGEQFYIYALA